MARSLQRFAPGIATLLTSTPRWIAGRAVGLVSHPAALDTKGRASADLLRQHPGADLVALFGPEHGFYGGATAGQRVGASRHRRWGIPIHSLYGANRRPSRHMLKAVDTIVFDLQDLGARPYTYVSTLRLVMEAAAEYGKRLIVCDRPIPLPTVTDGPVTQPGFESFVAAIPSPMHYGMTPGETAHWLKDELALDLDLRVARMRGYARDAGRQPGWPPWMPPSQGIRSWESAACYTATVFGEGTPAVDHGRGTGLPFQLVGAPWIRGEALREVLVDERLPGVTFHVHPYVSGHPRYAGKLLEGVRLCVTNPRSFRPIRTGVAILSSLQQLYGKRRIWQMPGARPEFFDKLYGTDTVRRMLMDGATARAVAATWRRESRRFRAKRSSHLLYEEED